MSENPQKNAQGGQDDTNREQPKFYYQLNQLQVSHKQYSQVPN